MPLVVVMGGEPAQRLAVIRAERLRAADNGAEPVRWRHRARRVLSPQ